MANPADNDQVDKDGSDKGLLWVATPAALEMLQNHLAGKVMIAVDTESNSLYAYFEKVCLLQFSTQDADALVDPLALPALGALAPIFANEHIEKVFHAAEYDILCLKRDGGFVFKNIFDTMVAARILGWKNVGLGNILRERFGVRLNKKMQRADWGRRPLSQEQRAYAREDTHYLLALRDLQMAELQKAGRLEEAREEFERLTRVEPTPRRFDGDAYWNIVGARALDAVRLGVLRELYHFREAQARREDRPPFKILSDATLLHLAQARPMSPRALGNISGVSTFIIGRYGHAILKSIERGSAAPQTSPPRPNSRRQPFLQNSARGRLGRLKEWRKGRAAARGVDPDVIVSNDVLFTLAQRNPRTLQALASATGLGPWKTREYGEDMLTVLQGKNKKEAGT